MESNEAVIMERITNIESVESAIKKSNAREVKFERLYYSCARMQRDNMQCQVFNLWPSRIFLDIGCWKGDSNGLARTDFAIVSENSVLLCSWLNMKKEGKFTFDDYKNYKEELKEKIPVIINEFFKKAPYTKIIDHFSDNFNYLKDNETLLFLPDLHLHLFKNSKVDNFIYNCNFWQKEEEKNIVTLEEELAELLKLADDLNIQIIQVGDCFEVWETAAHFAYHMYEFRASKGELQHPDREIREIINDEIDKFPYESNDKFVIQPQIYDEIYKYEIYKSPKPPIEELRIKKFRYRITGRDSLQYQEEIIARIMEHYPKIFVKVTPEQFILPFRWLRGNHDNMISFGDKSILGLEEELFFSGINNEAEYDKFNGGEDNCIWAEHGHRFDEMNKNDIFSEKWKGYFWTKYFTLGDIIGEMGFKKGEIEEKASERASSYYMRGEQLRLVYDIFENNPEVRLVIMGHTHEPVLIDWDEFLEKLITIK